MATGIWYATRQQVTRSLEIFNTARANPIIDAKIAAASVSIEGLLHRRFYPELRTIKADWPNFSLSPSWEFQLGDNELISKTGLVLVSGGTTIPNANVFLRRADDRDEPPYNILQVSLGSASSFAAGPLTFQQALSITGPFGYNDTDASIPSCALVGGINAAVTSLVLNPVGGIFTADVGSILLMDTERMILTQRRMSATGINTAGTLSASQANTILAVTDGTNFGFDEVILVDGERMRIVDIAGNNLIVDRAFDGTVLATHASGVGVFALRTFTAKRGALGSTAASHLTAASGYAHAFPPLINELCVAEAVTLLEQNAGGYARVIGSGSSSREAAGIGLADIRQQAVIAFGRKLRSGAV